MPSTTRQLFLGLLRCGTIGFGGGAALIPVIDRELVERRKLLDRATYTAHTVISNITPGAQPVKLGALAGASIGRPRDSLAGALAVALPGVVGTLALLGSFAAIGPAAVRFIEFAAVGISMFVIGLLGSYITKVVTSAPKWVTVSIIPVAFLLTGGPQLVRLVNALFGLRIEWEPPSITALELVLGAVLLIWVSSFLWRAPAVPPTGGERAAAAKASAQESSGALWLIVAFFVGIVAFALLLGLLLGGVGGLMFVLLIGASTLSSFGGGAAYIGVADGFFVSSGLVDSGVFYGQLVPVANAMPGPVLVKLAAGMGFTHGMESSGWLAATGFALAALFISVAACSAIAVVVLAFYAKHSQSVFLLRLDRFILPVICGLLLTTSCSMLNAMVVIGDEAAVPGMLMCWVGLAGVAVLWWLRVRFKLADVALLVAAGAASLGWLLLV